MRVLFIIAISVWTNLLVGQGITWQNGTIEANMVQAKEENKLVFLDFYTTWCRPCLQMDQAVFSDSEIGQLFADHFLSMKLNAEDGSSGQELARRYNINSYPTLVFVDSKGRQLLATIGYQSKYELISLARQIILLSQNATLLDDVMAHPDKTYTLEELRHILRISEIYSFEGKEQLAMNYMDQLDLLTEEDLKIVMGEVSKMDLTYLEQLTPLTASLSYNEIYLRKNKKDWIKWKTNIEKAVFDHLDRYKEANNLELYEKTLQILKGFDGVKLRKIDNLYLEFYKHNDLDQYRSFAIYLIEKYIIPTKPEDVKIADEEKYKMLQAEIMKDMKVAINQPGTSFSIASDEVTTTPTIDSLAEIYTISNSIANQLYEISGDFFAYYDDDTSREQAAFWASLTHAYYPYDWKYFDNHLYILEATGKAQAADQLRKEVSQLDWYQEMRQKKSF